MATVCSATCMRKGRWPRPSPSGEQAEPDKKCPGQGRPVTWGILNVKPATQGRVSVPAMNYVPQNPYRETPILLGWYLEAGL